MTPVGYLPLLPSFAPTKEEPKIDFAKLYVLNIDRTQQAYFQTNQSFANSVAQLSPDMMFGNKEYQFFTTNEPKIFTKDFAILSSKSFSQRLKPNLPDYLAFSWVKIVSAQDLNSNTEKFIEFYTIFCKTSGEDIFPTASDRVELTTDFKNAKCPEKMEQLNTIVQ